jgi:hypothetical protein
LAAVVLAVGISLLPRLLPAYDPIAQTVSEIGEVGSPARGVAEPPRRCGLDRDGAMWHREAVFYGVVQRSVFAAWFVWLAGASLMLRGVRYVGRPASLSG